MPRVNRDFVTTSLGCTTECRGTRRTSSKVSATSVRTRALPCGRESSKRAGPLSDLVGRAGRELDRVEVAIAKRRRGTQACPADLSAATRGRSFADASECGVEGRTRLRPTPGAGSSSARSAGFPTQYCSRTERPAFTMSRCSAVTSRNTSSTSPRNGMKSGMKSTGVRMYITAAATRSLSTAATRRSVSSPNSNRT